MRLIPFLAVILLTACASFTYDFKKPGATQQEKKRDWINCKAKLGQAGGSDNPDGFIKACMEGEGWERFEVEE